ncbi:putative carboxylesterase [Aspergillus alliaceus]|uniref:putative carboxylesterase n=1 Tax=Petromyces alliaceus TaxID=209559 RepID=UPI0012A67643|nr:Alpha/Beta hydrolase protein [Aspergillus alliaceus]KAB8238107.1 Alpha/Beta hydrolase protein [Aspergillus alliaceus]
MTATILQTKQLGQTQGLASAQLVDSCDGAVLDATKDGRTAISPLFGCSLGQDLDCLNLNITVPEGTTTSSNLPVIFFIHGGGLLLGANSWSQYDHARFVKLSSENNLSIIAVSIKQGCQMVVKEWVRRHIADFGGDPDNVTAAGMSAGAASVTYHLSSRSTTVQGSHCRAAVTSSLGLCRMRYMNRIISRPYRYWDWKMTPRKRLLEAPGQELIAKLPPSVLAAPTPAVAQRTLSEYGITKDASHDEAFRAVLDYINDNCFSAATLTIARGWRGNAHAYYFEGNPWEATYILDIAYLLQIFRSSVTVSAPWPAIIDHNIATTFTARVYGRSFRGLGVRKVSHPYNGESHRRSILFDYSNVVTLDNLAKVFDVFKTL